jgi:hypothetical protein
MEIVSLWFIAPKRVGHGHPKSPHLESVRIAMGVTHFAVDVIIQVQNSDQKGFGGGDG